MRTFLLYVTMACAPFIQGCVTTQSLSLPENLTKTLTSINPFKTPDDQLAELLAAKNFPEAEALYNDKFIAYFTEQEKSSDAVEALANHIIETEFQHNADSALQTVQTIDNFKNQSNWDIGTTTINSLSVTQRSISNRTILANSTAGMQLSRKLDDARGKLLEIAKRDWADALIASSEQVIATGKIPSGYPSDPFEISDYRLSPSFQARLQASLSERPQPLDLTANSHLPDLMSDETKLKFLITPLIEGELAKATEDGYVSIDDLETIKNLAKKYPQSKKIKEAVKIGFVDLTATSFRDRNIFDFTISFSDDFGFPLQKAQDDFLNGDIDSYNYILVADLQSAKIFREFKSKDTKISKFSTGTRQEPNPKYVSALTTYQQAMAEAQSVSLRNTVDSSKPCYGNAIACGLIAVARGVTEASAKNKAQEAANALSGTPQYITQPVYSEYNYELVDIDASKVAALDFYVIDIKKGIAFRNTVDLKDREVFKVAYNVHEKDEDRGSILRANQSEDDVVSWEKSGKTISISSLFSAESIETSNQQPFKSSELFLESLSKRTYVSADPQFASRGHESEILGQANSNIIADNRFSSVVIIKTSTGHGAGFYVTPELVPMPLS